MVICSCPNIGCAPTAPEHWAERRCTDSGGRSRHPQARPPGAARVAGDCGGCRRAETAPEPWLGRGMASGQNSSRVIGRGRQVTHRIAHISDPLAATPSRSLSRVGTDKRSLALFTHKPCSSTLGMRTP